MVKPVITLISDFGDDFAKAQLAIVINTINPQSKFIVASNEVKPFSILEGAFLLLKFYQFTPHDSIHIVVVDPGVGSLRKGLIIKSKNYWFIGPDNGVLYPASSQDEITHVYSIDYNKLGFIPSNTFHGRDVFAKVAGLISLGHSPSEFANEVPKDSIKLLAFKKYQVLHIDSYGNVKLSSDTKFNIGEKLRVTLPNGKTISLQYCKTFSDVSKGELLLYFGSHQTLELARNFGSAAKELDVKIGDELKIERII